MPDITPGIWRHLHEQEWPGKARELLRFTEEFAVGLEPALAGSAPAPPPGDLRTRVQKFEANAIRHCLSTADGNIAKAIAQLGLPRKTFYDKIARHGIDLGGFRSG